MQTNAISVFTALLMLFVTGTVHADSIPYTDEQDTREWSWFGDLMLRGDAVSGLPGGREDLRRYRGRGRFGERFNPFPELEFGAAIELADGSDRNRDNPRNNDNERSDSVNTDQLYLRWRMRENTALLAGKAPLPLELSPLVWDQDLRPIGLSVEHSFPVSDFNSLNLVGGYFAGAHLYGDDSRIAAVQAAWRWHESAPQSAEFFLTFLHFSDLSQLAAEGLARTNRRVGSNLSSDFRLLDAQMTGRTRVAKWPLAARIDLVRNLGADEQRNGARFSLILGDSRQPSGWEFGYAYQRIQRDAVLAAFNSDDWWFHSADRGFMPWIAYGIDANWSIRLAGFRELRDGLAEHTDRVLLDIFARW